MTTAVWQVTLCDPKWHEISRSTEVTSITNCYILTYTFNYAQGFCPMEVCIGAVYLVHVYRGDNLTSRARSN